MGLKMQAHDRYKIVKKIIDDWFSFKLNLDVVDIMPHLVFLYEENMKLKEKNQRGL